MLYPWIDFQNEYNCILFENIMNIDFAGKTKCDRGWSLVQ